MLLWQGEKSSPAVCSQTWNSTASHDVSTRWCFSWRQQWLSLLPPGHANYISRKTLPDISLVTLNLFDQHQWAVNSSLPAPFSDSSTVCFILSTSTSSYASAYFDTRASKNIIPIMCLRGVLSDSRSAVCRASCLPVTSEFLKWSLCHINYAWAFIKLTRRHWVPQSSSASACYGIKYSSSSLRKL